MSVVLNESRCPSCHVYVKAEAESCAHCGATWEAPK